MEALLLLSGGVENQLLFQGHFRRESTGEMVGHVSVFLKLVIAKKAVILHLDSNMERPQCSNTKLFKEKFPDREVDELDWDQFFVYEEAFIHKVAVKFNDNCKTFHNKLAMLKKVLDADDPDFPEEDPEGSNDPQMELDHDEKSVEIVDRSQMMSQLGEKGRDASKRSRKLRFSGRKRRSDKSPSQIDVDSSEDGTFDHQFPQRCKLPFFT